MRNFNCTTRFIVPLAGLYSDLLHISPWIRAGIVLFYTKSMPSIFISGAAQGIGKAVAQKFLQEGWTVGAYDIAPVAYDATGTPGTLITGHLNVTSATDWDVALEEFTSHTGGTLDVLDNNAGIIIDGPLSEAAAMGVDRLISVNCTGVTLGARAAHPHLKRTPGAQLVNMTSASAVYGQPNIAVYSATKFYVAGLTEALSLEWRKDDIRVVDVWPLWAKTSLADVDVASTRRIGVHLTPEQVAGAVWQAVHPKNRWARGKVHHGVATLDKALYLGRSLAPDRVVRMLTRVLAG